MGAPNPLRRRHHRPWLQPLIAGFLLLGVGSCSSDPGGGGIFIPAPEPSSIHFVPFASVPTGVTAITAPPGDTSRVFIVRQEGEIMIVKHNVLLPRPFLNLYDEVRDNNEMGTLGMAFAPDYRMSGVFYVCYTSRTEELRVRRFHVSATNPDSAVLLTEEPVFTLALPYELHHAGSIAFGPDGKLYVPIGDCGPQYDLDHTGQDPSDLRGNVLRLGVTNAGAYTVPGDNPFVGKVGYAPEIWSYGLRNPWGMSFDRSTGDLYIPDVGQDRWEEVNVGVASAGRGKGANYGWSVLEGTECGYQMPCDSTGKTMPVLAYGHNIGAGECAIIAGRVYRGRLLPGLSGAYLYSDFCAGWLRSFRFGANGVTDLKDWGFTFPPQPQCFGEDANGEVYVGTSAGDVLKLMP